MRLCTYIIQFTHKKGNGWAIVNANSPAQASSVFLRQTKYLDPKVATVNQSPYEGQEMQLVIEGSIDTFAKGVYDLAVINGFKGTEKDFLDSLKGEKGDSFTFEDLTPEQLYLIARAAPAINNARFDSQNKTISLLHDDEVLSVLDARPFLKDGMLNSVSIVNRRLVLSFNTDAGKEDISLGLDDIFNPNNYYTKTESDSRFAGKPFKVTLSSREEGGKTVWSADKTFAEILAAYQAGRDIVAIYDGAEVALNEYIGSGSFVFTIHYDNIVQQVFISEVGVGITPLTFVEESNVATINSQSLTSGGNITLPTPADITSLRQALANYCPIIEDTRTSVSSNITGVAPFASLVDGQRIMLKLAYNTTWYTTLTLTLSDGTTTEAIGVYFASYLGGSRQVGMDNLSANSLVELMFQSSNNKWQMVGYGDYNSVYSGISQAELDAGTATAARAITAKVLRDNFYLKSEVDNLCPIIEDTRESGGPAITGVAPFSELVDGQRIVLRLRYLTMNESTLNLTLSNGTTTGGIYLYYRIVGNSLSKLYGAYGLFIAGQYVEMFYTAATNCWVCVSDHDTNTTYIATTQAEIDAGTGTTARSITPKLLVDNFEKRTQIVSVDNQSAQVEQALESNKFYKFLNPVDELTLTLVAPTGYGDVMGIYAGKFTASSTWDSLVLPASVSIASGAPTITAGGAYEFNICDNILMLSEI